MTQLAHRFAKIRTALNAGENEALEWVQFGETNGVDFVLDLLDEIEKAEAKLTRYEEAIEKARPSDEAIEHRDLYTAADVDDLLDDLVAALDKQECVCAETSSRNCPTHQVAAAILEAPTTGRSTL